MNIGITFTFVMEELNLTVRISRGFVSPFVDGIDEESV